MGGKKQQKRRGFRVVYTRTHTHTHTHTVYTDVAARKKKVFNGTMRPQTFAPLLCSLHRRCVYPLPVVHAGHVITVTAFHVTRANEEGTVAQCDESWLSGERRCVSRWRCVVYGVVMRSRVLEMSGVRFSSVGMTRVLEHNTAWGGVSYCWKSRGGWKKKLNTDEDEFRWKG